MGKPVLMEYMIAIGNELDYIPGDLDYNLKV